LSHGGRSTWLFEALNIKDHAAQLIDSVHPCAYLVGIELGGAIIASAASRGQCGVLRKASSKGRRLWVPAMNPEVSLFDDVVTTEGTFREATEYLNLWGIKVVEYLAVMDRRPAELRTLEVRSVCTAEQLGLDTNISVREVANADALS
jgi:orotate phosphoribosyltransferase